MNKVQLIGHLGMDPEMREFGPSKMARMSIATDASYRNAEGQQVKQSHWHTLVMWGKLATAAATTLCKGSKVAISGKLVNRTYETKAGLTQKTCEVHVAHFLLLER